MSKTNSQPRSRRDPAYRPRRSPVHGTGLFATRAIRKGALIIEYIGERISHKEADRRHAHKDADDNHTFLFTVDSKTVIDGGVGGNEARLINHSCEPNCEVILEDGRLLIEAARTIRPGEEFVYDYMITRAPNDPPEVERIFACRCGAASCRGTMLEPQKKPKARKKTAAAQKSKSAAASKGQNPKSAAASKGQNPKSAAASKGQNPKSAAASKGRRGVLPRGDHRKTGRAPRDRRQTSSSAR